MLPQEGSGGWTPTPRNEMAASKSTAPAISKEAFTRRGVERVGQDVPEGEPQGEAPRARAALTKSAPFRRMNSARA